MPVRKKPLVVGVAGGSGSGKTTIVNAILVQIGRPDMVMLQHDSYYRDNAHLPMAERAQINYDHPDSLETDLLIRHLRELIAGREVEVPVYDFANHCRLAKGLVKKPAKVIFVEGILIFLDKKLRDLMDVKIFVETDGDIRIIRRLLRDIRERQRTMESVIQQYLETVRPMHMQFVEPSRRYADIIIPEGHNPVSTDLVVTMLKHVIGEFTPASERATPHGASL